MQIAAPWPQSMRYVLVPLKVIGEGLGARTKAIALTKRARIPQES